MTKSALQIARASYQPKTPKSLKGFAKAVEGEKTQSVADQEEISKLFPNTYGIPVVHFEETGEKVEYSFQGCLTASRDSTRQAASSALSSDPAASSTTITWS